VNPRAHTQVSLTHRPPGEEDALLRLVTSNERNAQWVCRFVGAFLAQNVTTHTVDTYVLLPSLSLLLLRASSAAVASARVSFRTLVHVLLHGNACRVQQNEAVYLSNAAAAAAAVARFLSMCESCATKRKCYAHLHVATVQASPLHPSSQAQVSFQRHTPCPLHATHDTCVSPVVKKNCADEGVCRVRHHESEIFDRNTGFNLPDVIWVL
jgi:hypothetical protein